MNVRNLLSGDVDKILLIVCDVTEIAMFMLNHGYKWNKMKLLLNNIEIISVFYGYMRNKTLK